MSSPLFGMLTQESPEYKRRMLASQMLMQQGPAQNPSRSPIEGALRMLTQIGGGLIANRAMAKDEAQRSEAGKMLANAITQPANVPIDGGHEALIARLSESTSPDARQMARGLSPEAGNLLSGAGPQQANAGPMGREALIARLSGSGNPYAQQMGQGFAIMDLMRPGGGRDGTPESFGTPQTVMGPEGKPVLAQFGNRGTARAVEGFAPTPDEKTLTAAKPMHLGGGVLYDPATGKVTTVDEVQQRELAQKQAGATRIQQQISPTAIYKSEEGKSMEELFGSLGKGIAGQQDQASQAAQTATTITQLNKELEGVPTGLGAEARTTMLKALKASGLSDEAANAELAKREAAGRVSGGMVMDQLNAMKGPATEREREYLQEITPGLATTPQGRARMEAIARHQADRARAKADASAAIANEVQQRQLPIGDAQKKLREMNDLINKQFDEKLGASNLGGTPAPAAAGASKKAAPKRIKIDAQGNIVR